VGFVVNKVALGQVPPSTSVSPDIFIPPNSPSSQSPLPGFLRVLQFPLTSSFHQILHLHDHQGQVQQAGNGRHAEWTQFGLQTTTQIKKKKDNDLCPVILVSEL
jgi:hypothetical protein